MCDRVLYRQRAKYIPASPCLTVTVYAPVCLHTCFCWHARPGLTLLQFAPFGTAMRLVCKDWRQTMRHHPASAPLPALCPRRWAPGRRTQSIPQHCKIGMPAALAAHSQPCALPKHACTPLPTGFNKAASGVL